MMDYKITKMIIVKKKKKAGSVCFKIYNVILKNVRIKIQYFHICF